MSREHLRILILVMTYPHPSARHKEIVCTAGITESGEWIRLYPLDYRYRPKAQRFHKYQWIEIEVESRGAGNDQRPESRNPNFETLRTHGPPIGPENRWRIRRELIDALPHRTVDQFKELYEANKTSLGVVRPARVLDIEVRPANPEWKPEWQNLFDQLNLFGPPAKPLRKLPFTFHYVFECEDSKKPHTAMIEDWELGVLFLKESARLGSDDLAAASVKKKYLDQMCSPTRDTRFFMGTKFPYNTWLVLGVFWPPHVRPSATQSELF